jgi:ATP-dependent DNA helicase RecG
VEIVVSDGKGELTAKFFNQQWRERVTEPGMWGIFSGEIERYKSTLQLIHPEIVLFGDESDAEEGVEKFDGTYLPFYHSKGKCSSLKIRKAVDLVLDSLDSITDYLPANIKAELDFPDLDQALREVHHKSDDLANELAFRRLKFDEAYLLQIYLLQRKRAQQKVKTFLRKAQNLTLLSTFESNLPYSYTAGQLAVIAEIDHDLASDTPMHRLLQGEVGSGKTLVALRTILKILETGAQAALIAPTEVLATQHYLTFQKLLGDLAQGGTLQGGANSISMNLLTGSTPGKVRKEILANLKSGQTQLLIGTHSLISDGVEFNDLALVVVDEQHRFGVEQRDALRMKAKYPPHLLVMTATPIPRTVAMTFFGDLEVSSLQGLPGNRQPIETHLINGELKPAYVERAWNRVLEEVAKGHQVYIVTARIGLADDGYHGNSTLTPELKEFALEHNLIENLEDLSKEANVTSLYQLYQELTTGPLSGVKTGILHGALSAREKEETMAAFARNEISVLFSTTVIEVGVDVPNATMMVIYDADRFGISQLHQLRGRIGRGSEKSLALLITKAPIDTTTYERLTEVSKSNDGFYLAQVDLESRREGNILGTAQSGSKSILRLLRVLEDLELIELARNAAQATLTNDPELANNPALKVELSNLAKEEASSYLEKS